MVDQDFMRFLASLGVGGIIAGLMFMFYRKDVRLYTDQWKGQSELLMQVVRENTAAVTANTTVVQSMHERLDLILGNNHRPDDDGAYRQHSRKQ
jgi:hypothetical protein